MNYNNWISDVDKKEPNPSLALNILDPAMSVCYYMVIGYKM